MTLHYYFGKKGKSARILNYAAVSINVIDILIVAIGTLITGGLTSPFVWIYSLIVIVNLLILGYDWSIWIAAGSVLAMIVVEFSLQGFGLVQTETFVDFGTELATRVFLFSSLIILVKYAESKRLIHGFGLDVGIKKNEDVRNLLVSMVGYSTMEKSLENVKKNLKYLIDFDYIAFATVKNNAAHFLYQMGLSKTITGCIARLAKSPERNNLKNNIPCCKNFQIIDCFPKLTSLGVRNSIISPVLDQKRLVGLLFVGSRNRRVDYSETDIELIHTLSEQLAHVWKLQSTVKKLRENERRIKIALKEKKNLQLLKSEFISVASHQLRTPLSSMRWFLEMLKGGDYGPLTEDQRGAVEQITESNQRMITLVNDLLDVSKVEDGKIEAKIKPIAVEAVIESAVSQHHIISNAKNISLTFEKPKKALPLVLADPTLLDHVIDNLISNSVKYTNARGKVTVSATVRDQMVQIAIADTGIGIKKSDSEKIFSKFFRAAEVKKMQTGGSGLGLYLSKAMVEVMNGDIWFESRHGKGSTFFLSIPISKKL
jgi:signal transduction histidine kinase